MSFQSSQRKKIISHLRNMPDVCYRSHYTIKHSHPDASYPNNLALCIVAHQDSPAIAWLVSIEPLPPRAHMICAYRIQEPNVLGLLPSRLSHQDLTEIFLDNTGLRLSTPFTSIRTTPRHLRQLILVRTIPPCVISLANPARDLQRGLLLPFGTLALPASHNQARTLLRRIRPLHELIVDEHHSNVFQLQGLLTIQDGCNEMVITGRQ